MLCSCGGSSSGGAGGPFFDLADFGGRADGCRVLDGAINSGTNVLTAASANFLTAVTGTYIQVTGAGTAGGVLQSTIAGVNTATSVTLADAAGTTVTGAPVLWGTVNDFAVQRVIDAGFLTSGGTLVFDMGITILGKDSNGLLHITQEIGDCGLGWNFIGFGYPATIIAQAGSWSDGLISSFGRHGFANGLRCPVHTCGWQVQGDPGFGGLIVDGWQMNLSGDLGANDFPGTLVKITSGDEADFYLYGTGNGKLSAGAPSLQIVQNDEGGVTVGRPTRNRFRLHLLDNKDHGVFLSQDVDTTLLGYVQGSGLVRSNVWSTDSTGLDTDDLDCDTASDDNVHLQSEGNAAYARTRGHYRNAGGTTPGTGNGVNVAAATADQVHLGHDPECTEGIVAGWPLSATADKTAAQTRANVAYGDLTGGPGEVGPSVSVQITPKRPNLYVEVSAFVGNDTLGDGALMSFLLDAVAATDDKACGFYSETAGALPEGDIVSSRLTRIAGLSYGLHTVTAKYRSVGGGTATFFNRRITAWAAQ